MGQALGAEGLTAGGAEVRNSESPAILPAHSPRQPHQRHRTLYTDVSVHRISTRSLSHGLQQASCTIPLQNRCTTLSHAVTTPGWAHEDILHQTGIAVHSNTYINILITIHVDNQKSVYTHTYIYNYTHGLGHRATAGNTYGGTATQTCPPQHSCSHGHTATPIVLYMETQ